MHEPEEAPDSGRDVAAADTARRRRTEVAATPELVLEALRPIVDPELAIGIVDLGLVYGVEVDRESRHVTLRMTLTSPSCPYGPQILNAVQAVLSVTRGVESCDVQLVWEPAWNPRQHARKEVRAMLNVWD